MAGDLTPLPAGARIAAGIKAGAAYMTEKLDNCVACIRCH
jgi:hypothetical protein